MEVGLWDLNERSNREKNPEMKYGCLSLNGNATWYGTWLRQTIKMNMCIKHLGVHWKSEQWPGLWWHYGATVNFFRCDHGAVCVLSCFSHVQLFVALWTAIHQAPPSVGFSSQEYWSVLPCAPPGDLPEPGIEPTSLMSPVLAGGFFTTGATWEARSWYCGIFNNSDVLAIQIKFLWTSWHEQCLGFATK